MKCLAASDRMLMGWPAAAVLAAYGGFCVLAVLGCPGDSGSTTAWDGVVRDSAGIEIVENFGTPLWPEGPGWEFTEVLRIGAAYGRPEYQFGRIGGLQVLSDGRIAVTDAMAHHLRFFSPEGVHECTVGREGQGPGEFGSGSLWLLRGPGDTLLVLDGANYRMHVIAPDGTWLESWSTRPGDGYSMGSWTGTVPTGRITSLHRPLRQGDGTLSDTLDTILERDVHGAVLDRLARLPSYLTFFRGGPGTLQRYYNARWTVLHWGDGIVIARTDEYRFRWYGPDRALKRIVSLAREPLAITDEDRSVMLRSWDEYLRENRVAADRWAEIKSALRFADTFPPYRLSFYGPAATLLAQRVRPLRDLGAEEQKEIRPRVVYPPGSPEWDVFDREGRYLGAVVIPGTEFPERSGFFRFFQDRATGTWYMVSIWEDELDLQYIVRWRIDGRMPG